jgi:hypothetical protein
LSFAGYRSADVFLCFTLNEWLHQLMVLHALKALHQLMALRQLMALYELKDPKPHYCCF